MSKGGAPSEQAKKRKGELETLRTEINKELREWTVAGISPEQVQINTFILNTQFAGLVELVVEKLGIEIGELNLHLNRVMLRELQLARQAVTQIKAQESIALPEFAGGILGPGGKPIL